MSTVERLSSNAYTNSDGDVLPYADIEHDLDSSLVHNASIVQARHNLDETNRYERYIAASEAQARMNREQLVIDEGMRKAGPHVRIEQLAQHQLNYMNIMAAIAVKGSFYANGPLNADIQDRFGADLPIATKGAKRNQQDLIHRGLPAHYQAPELIQAGFDAEDVLFMAKTTMPSEYRATFVPNKQHDSPEVIAQKEAARTSYRRSLRKKLHKK